jgi:hypothetical protein
MGLICGVLIFIEEKVLHGGNTCANFLVRVIMFAYGSKAILGKKVGDGSSTSFWCDRWLGNFSLKELFDRLYLLFEDKDSSIKSLGEWVDGHWVWK